MTMTSVSSISRYDDVPPPAPNTVARPTTEGACQVRLHESMLFVPITALANFWAMKFISLVDFEQEKKPTAGGPCLVLRRAETVGSAVQGFVPRRRPQLAVLAHERPGEALVRGVAVGHGTSVGTLRSRGSAQAERSPSPSLVDVAAVVLFAVARQPLARRADGVGEVLDDRRAVRRRRRCRLAGVAGRRGGRAEVGARRRGRVGGDGGWSACSAAHGSCRTAARRCRSSSSRRSCCWRSIVGWRGSGRPLSADARYARLGRHRGRNARRRNRHQPVRGQPALSRPLPTSWRPCSLASAPSPPPRSSWTVRPAAPVASASSR